MPTYEYECTKCGLEFELEQAMTDKPRQRCPECRGKVNRLISGGAGIAFKGSGYYVTDSRRSAAKSAKSADAAKPAPQETPKAPAADSAASGS
ncbi:MAG TPA: zinc ribbon domain-containing protein [Candidatus Krumholzibacteria bacterium]|nr:zinc ribbon domain-containing protein [Candidatus Krumholzibacteria bacterium]